MFGIAVAAQAKPVISKDGVSVEQIGACRSTANPKVEAPTAGYFTAQSAALQKLLGGARLALSFEWPDAQNGSSLP